MKIIRRVEQGEKMVVIACSYNTELLALQKEELTNEDLMELQAQRKNERRQEEDITEQLKRFIMQEMPRGFSLFEEALLVFEAQDLDAEQYTEIAAAVQNAFQCYPVIYDERRPRSFCSRGKIEWNPARNQNL